MPSKPDPKSAACTLAQKRGSRSASHIGDVVAALNGFAASEDVAWQACSAVTGIVGSVAMQERAPVVHQCLDAGVLPAIAKALAAQGSSRVVQAQAFLALRYLLVDEAQVMDHKGAKAQLRPSAQDHGTALASIKGLVYPHGAKSPEDVTRDPNAVTLSELLATLSAVTAAAPEGRFHVVAASQARIEEVVVKAAGPKGSTNPTSTVLSYWEDSYCFSADDVVAEAAIEVEDPKAGKLLAVVLQRTIFHPQGGGQPSDVGTITGASGAKFDVAMVKKVGTVVHHYGAYAGGGSLAAGETVHLAINEPARRLHARLHSAGHLLDIAMLGTAFSGLKPGKGSHTAENPFVEYIGAVPAESRAQLVLDLNERLKQLIAQDDAVMVMNEVPYAEIAEKCGGSVPEYLPNGQSSRVVLISPEGPGCPCGGTHVKSSGDLGSVEVTGLKVKKGNTTVKYKLN